MKKHDGWLTAFIDDDPAIIDQLHANGIPALKAATLVAVGGDPLRDVLDVPLRTTTAQPAR